MMFIITYLGIGIVHFGNKPPVTPPTKEDETPTPPPGGMVEISSSKYTYRPDIYVITSIEISIGEDITPSEPKSFTAYAYIEGQGTVSIPIVVKKLIENEPPRYILSNSKALLW